MYKWKVERVPHNAQKLEDVLNELEHADFVIYSVQAVPGGFGFSEKTFVVARMPVEAAPAAS